MDCNKTINFLHELKRLCDSRDGCVADAANKERCPMFGICEDVLTKIDIEDATKLIEIMQKRSDEHSKKTYAQDFFEKFPDAPKDEAVKGKFPWACRIGIYGGNCDNTGACYECWNELMEE